MAENKRRAEIHAVFDGRDVQVDVFGRCEDVYATAAIAVANILCIFPDGKTKQEVDKFAGAVYAHIKRLEKE